MLIFKIAKAELRTIFFSPVAWFISIAFLFLWGTVYTQAITNAVNYQEALIKYMPNFKDFNSIGMGLSLTALLLGDPAGDSMGVFPVAVKYLFLFVPLLTMGLISREMQGGTDKLLYSSPVRLRQIVLGKFLGMVVYNLLLIAIIGVFFISILFSVKAADTGFLLSATVGLFVMMCTYSAIGMFMSSLTNYQIVSAIAAFIVLGILNQIGNLWQRVDIVRDLTYFLSLSGRGEKMLMGLMTSKDLIYFLLVTGMFVCFTIIRLKSPRESKAWYITPARYVAVLLVILLVGYISSRPGLTAYWDATATDRNTLPENIQQIIKRFDKGPLEATLYTNLTGYEVKPGMPEFRNKIIARTWEPYLRFKPDIKLNFEYYYDYEDGGGESQRPVTPELKRMAVNNAKYFKVDLAMFKTPEQIRKEIQLKEEAYQPVWQLKYQGKTSYLRWVSEAVPDKVKEQIEAASLKRLLQPAPKVYFITGHYERSMMKTGERDYADHTIRTDEVKALVNHGFDFDTLSLDTQNLPDTAAALVLADPRMELGPAAIGKLQQYIAKGGNMMILGEPGKQHLLAPLLSQLGVTLMQGQLVQISKDETPDKVLPYMLEAATTVSRSLADVYAAKKARGEELNVLMPGAVALTSDEAGGFEVKTLLASATKQAWLKAGKLVADSAEVVYTPQEGDTAASFPVVLGLTRMIDGKQQRIAVTGDADFLNNQRYKAQGNIDVVYALYSWMNDDEFPVYAPRPNPNDVFFTIGMTSARVQQFLFTWILPELLIIFAAVFLIRRKRK